MIPWRHLAQASAVRVTLRSGAPIHIVDATWFMPGSPRVAADEHAKARLPGAVYFDLDGCCDTETDLPHMMPSHDKLARYLAQLGMLKSVPTVVYDASDQGCFSAARVWWMLLAAGMESVAVLDGGLRGWRAQGFEVESGPSPSPVVATDASHFVPPSAAPSRFVDSKAVLAASETGSPFVVDARSKGRFDGTEKEPREGLLSGHIPGSLNVPFTSLLSEDGTFLPAAQVQELFTSQGVPAPLADQRFIFSCGSGVTACVPLLALVELCGVAPSNCAVYDGAFAEWGQPEKGLPIAVAK